MELARFEDYEQALTSFATGGKSHDRSISRPGNRIAFHRVGCSPVGYRAGSIDGRHKPVLGCLFWNSLQSDCAAVRRHWFFWRGLLRGELRADRKWFAATLVSLFAGEADELVEAAPAAVWVRRLGAVSARHH
jgi:hypothetical protein